MSDKFQVRLPESLHAEAKAAATAEFMPLTSYVARAVRAYLDKHAPKPEKPVKLLAAERHKLDEKERRRQELQHFYNTLPQYDEDGFEIYRGELTEGWTPNNPGYGYVTMLDQMQGRAVYVRIPEDQHPEPPKIAREYVSVREPSRSEEEVEEILRQIDEGLVPE